MAQPKQKIREFTEEEMSRLVCFVEILMEIDQEEKRCQRRIIDEPKGFAMKGEGRNCSLCYRSVWGETEGWCDKWGFKCLNCQDAINKRMIPCSLCRDHKNQKQIVDAELPCKTGVHTQTIRKLVRQGKITVCRIPRFLHSI